MKADIKSSKVRRIITLLTLPLLVPLRFLFSHALAIWSFSFKPYPTAFQEFGIRVVAIEDYGTWNDQVKVYVALELLNRHDKGELELVKKYIRIIFLWPIKNKERACHYMGAGVFLLDIQKIPVERRVPTIISWLVYEASRLKFAGRVNRYFGTFGTSKELEQACKEEQQRTMQKFRE